MSLSNDSWEWHLTPTGWVLGTERLDQFVEYREIPEDRVLSGRFEETLEDAFSELKLTWEVIWAHTNVDPGPLLAKFGHKPRHIAENVLSATL
jgi:hypothetical protein